eukprot:jgi/Mesen1/10149/ME000076S09663
MNAKKVGKYEVGRTLGEGTFAKVKFAQNVDTGESVALKVLDKEKILKHKMVNQIKREISIMKLVRHPNVVRLHEVLASRTRIYIVLEFVTGGELFDKIVHQGRLKEDSSRKYFQQLIDAVEFCHSKGPENLLLDDKGHLKISDFGLSALPHQFRDDGLLHTTCGTPNYVAPEVLDDKGYDGARADLWSCGVILFVLMAGFLPFDEADLMTLYKKIHKAEFKCPAWFSPGATNLINKILQPDPAKRASYEAIRQDAWFREGYIPVRPYSEEEGTSLDDIHHVFSDSHEHHIDEVKGSPRDIKDLDLVRRQTRFTSKAAAREILESLEGASRALGFRVQVRGFKMRLEGAEPGRVGHLSVAVQVFEVAPGLYMVEVRKAAGDTLDYHKEEFQLALFKNSKLAFRLYDLRRTGYIEREEVKAMLLALLSESEMSFSDDVVESILDSEQWDSSTASPRDITTTFPSFVFNSELDEGRS